ncbi:MAG: XdhC/CoxI family protein [Dehalococcoidia bacterium]|nr:XdhC/CoxI family protein [Dehalococcoidia bacterium]
MGRSEEARIFEEVLAAQASGPPVVLATVIQAPPDAATVTGAKLLLRRDGSTRGSLGGGPLEEAVLADARDAFHRRSVEALAYAADGSRISRREAESVGGGYQVMLERHEPAATLVIVGGGHIGKALATIAGLCGFSVVVIDDRPDYANQERFPEAGRVVCGDFAEVLRGLPIDSNTYVVTVTRGHKHDEESLRQVVGSPAAYVGMIGSKRRVAAVLQHLIDDGLDPEAVRRVHTPIGLDIGAETPEEIAVSIMAEVVQVRRGGSGRPMREAKKARRGIAPSERVPPQAEGEEP